MNYPKHLKSFFLAIIVIAFFGCNENGTTSLTQGTSKISVKLMDSPGDYDNVFIEVLDIMVKVNDDSEDENGWQSLEAINTGIYDLLELTGGINVLLVDDYEIPSGMLNQIRLILGEDNTIVIDGETFSLKTPSAQQSGLKIKVNETVEAGYNYTFLLDFDVDESIVIAGNSGNINLKPVIRATVEATTGAISGSVTPVDIQTEISATNGTDTISAFTDEEGNFVLVGLAEGIYTVTVTPDPASELISQTIENVDVSVGQTTDLAIIALEYAGAISGSVTPAEIQSEISATNGTDTISVFTDEEGNFMLVDLVEGTYTVTVTPDTTSELTPQTIENVDVIAGETTDIGIIALE